MEIRRKVFSRLQDENGEERLYSTTEFELSYSEDGEKMFSEKEDKKMSTGAKVAAGVGGAAVATIGALEIANLLKKKTLTSKERKLIKDWLAQAKERGMSPEKLKNLEKSYKENFLNNKEGIKIVEKSNEAVKGAYNTAKVNTQIALDKAKTAINEAKEEIRDAKKTREWNKAEKENYKKLWKEAEDQAKKEGEAKAKAEAHNAAMEGVPARRYHGKSGQYVTRNSARK